MRIEIKPTRTQDSFIRSKATVAALIGPQGEGKTWAGAIAMWHKGQQWKRKTGQPMPGAIIRDTHSNIKRMTVPAITKSFSHQGVGTLIDWSDDYHKLRSLDHSLEIDLFGMDDLGALTRIQGAEYAFIWIEEPAPMIERANAGISQEVFDACVSRVARAINTVHEEMGLLPRLQITMNPADEDHWTFHELIEDPRFPSDEFPKLSIEVFNIPYLENPYQSDISRQATRAAFKNDTGLHMRYVEGKFAFVMVGVKVAPEYNEKIHRAGIDLKPLPACQGYRFWDGGLNPTCVIFQSTPSGRLFGLDTLVGENIGMRQLIRTRVKPLMDTKYAAVKEWRDIGDPALRQREQSDSENTASAIIEEELSTTFEPAPVDWNARREGIKEALSRLSGGEPMVLLSRNEGILHRALRGGWHYRKDATGKVMSDKPVKDKHSHPGDAFGYGMAVILGKGGRLQENQDWKNRMTYQQARFAQASYNVLD